MASYVMRLAMLMLSMTMLMRRRCQPSIIFEEFVGSGEDEVTPLWRQALQLRPDDARVNHDLSARLSQSTKKKLRKEAVALAEAAAGVPFAGGFVRGSVGGCACQRLAQ